MEGVVEAARPPDVVAWADGRREVDEVERAETRLGMVMRVCKIQIRRVNGVREIINGKFVDSMRAWQQGAEYREGESRKGGG